MMLRFGPNIEIASDDNLRKLLRFQYLVDDLEKLARGKWPNIHENPGAPILEEWRLGVRTVPCLEGLVTGHPKIPGARREITTSEIIAFSPQLGWARTLSRWYRLAPRDQEIRSVSDDQRR
ncbi:DUF6634 family protein [Mesorhizobium sp. KR2-14]|uniref:DUF6634 family protein n=1 Tax=Mesorhizobium sp. KR2-14 TaxID=3156610 RepID=UPI0032B58188